MVAYSHAHGIIWASCVMLGVALRAGSVLRQQWEKVAMPTPALDGKLGADQLAAYDKDWQVSMLLLIAGH